MMYSTSISRRQNELLVIDDIPDQQALIDRILQTTIPRLTTTWAADGPSALAYLTDCLATRQQRLPRLILLDLYLPDREDGWDVLRQLKARPQLASIPVVMLSHSRNATDIDLSYKLGVTSYIAKPDTLDAWTHYLELVRQYWLSTVSLPS